MECLFAKMLPLEQKQTVRQMSLMRTTCPGKLVWFSWYQRKSCVVCLHNPGGSGSWLQPLAGTGGFAADTMFPLLLKSLCIIRCPQNQVKKLIVKLLFIRRQPLRAAWHCCRGLFSAWNRMVNREHSRGWALQCTAVLIALLHTPTPFHTRSASDNRSVCCSAQSLPFFERSRICPAFPSLLYSSCFSHHVESPSHP